MSTFEQLFPNTGFITEVINISNQVRVINSVKSSIGGCGQVIIQDVSKVIIVNLLP